jgi:glycosyltransferase involved in cell wall biosynthesis
LIYVCIPSRDEAHTLGPILWKVQKVFRAFGRDFRLVVFDDASSDETSDVLERYGGRLPLDVLRSEVPVGYGTAVDRLLRHVVESSAYPKRDAAVVLQADLTEDPAEIVDLVKTLEGGADVVAGATHELPEDAPSPLRWGRRLAPWVLGAAYREAPATDPLCGMRAYRVIVLKKALREEEGELAGAEMPWVANLELLHRVAPFARRMEDVALTPRYALHARESRFRVVPVLKDLFRRRALRWEPGSSGGDRDRAA